MLQVTFPIHLKTHLHEQHLTASEQINAVSQPPLWLEGLLLISQPI